ncbi:MAG: L-rhamnose mutarotase [Ancrocorticia sp.]|jgi:L-rhamnose mutarotase|nr:L-rhamnose mutarotase [Ancrocorticia sp.]MCI1964109.1 L-rhamnose mutarotase [Ancrocorticia sp.]MCI2001793.1 L-rhamnose mutarotase [Ancrocorticia sp.]MCI2013382.1 L-rhamnose mutarotase [Ancrocorticia sp.]MCI2030172.1 L-rhamnose mutarotase [Ancrocorticia sp.]
MNSSDNATKLDELLQNTTQKSPHRCCFLLRVRQEMLPEYVGAHQHVWDEMREALSSSGWRNYSLFLQPETGMVVGYFESDDTDQAQKAMAATDVNTRWQATMSKYFVQPDGGTNEILPQYFYLA